MLVIAHRGASAAAPENTPEAFELADRMGADGVELDVRRWSPPAVSSAEASPRLVVHHDPLPGDPDGVASMPDLDDVLDACGDRMLVNVEIKNGGPSRPTDPSMAVVDATLDALRARGERDRDRWLISSFSPSTVAHVRHVAPDLRTALLVETWSDEVLVGAALAGHVALHPDVETVTPDLVERAHALGLLVTVWTCNAPDRILELDDLDVDGVCTDVPDVALSSLGRSGDDPMSDPRWPWRPPVADPRS